MDDGELTYAEEVRKARKEAAPLGLYAALCRHDSYDVLRAVNEWLNQNRSELQGFVGHINAHWGFTQPAQPNTQDKA